MRSKTGCLYAFDNGDSMLRSISTPFLKALDDKQQVVISRQSLCETTWFHRVKTRFWGFEMVVSGGTNGNILEPLKNKKHPGIEHNSAYIYIYIYIYFFFFNIIIIIIIILFA